jgi:hypothetical protein
MSNKNCNCENGFKIIAIFAALKANMFIYNHYIYFFNE